LSPLIYDNAYIDSIINFCKENDITAVISVFDIDLLVLAKAKSKFENNGIRLLLSDASVVELCNDKWRTFELAKELNIDTPKTFKTLDAALEALQSGQVQFPLIIKPRWGMASMGIYKVENAEELMFFYRKSIKDIQNSYLKYESSFTPDEAVLIQEFLVGQEYGLDVMNDIEGQFICVLPKSKIQMRAGETDLGQTITPTKFEAFARKISARLKHEVILSVDCFEREGKLYLIEMNCRISGHYPLSHLAGTNLPLQILEWMEGKPTDMKNYQFREGLLITKDLLPVILK
jgi:carbamoyl-phosphate synthase large subunit